MSKFAVFAACFVALLALSQANRFTITTTVDEDGVNQGGMMQRCRQQIQQQMQQLRHCQQYMSSGMMMMQMMDTPAIQEVMGQGGQQQHLRQCCMTLQNFNEQCRCEAVKAAFDMACSEKGQGSWQGQGQQQMMEQMRMKARYLPQQCNMRPMQCEV